MNHFAIQKRCDGEMLYASQVSLSRTGGSVLVTKISAWSADPLKAVRVRAAGPRQLLVDYSLAKVILASNLPKTSPTAMEWERWSIPLNHRRGRRGVTAFA